ncbi:MAG: DUF1553 domain-containing protein, partial [Planctomycetales bacterium]|nr:DUF1553 domain-containing protein [Planctomycetales bacterium]
MRRQRMIARCVRSVRLGILVAFAGIALAEPARAQAPLHERIDAMLESAHPAQPAPLASDAEFVRRIYLDLIGTIPTADEARQFIDDQSPDKREKLIDRLLASPEFTRHMTTVLDVMWMERRPDKHVKTDEWRAYLHAAIAANRPLNELVREILAADGVDDALRPAAKFYLDREGEPNLLTRDVGRMFFGMDLQCAQCHDHPFDRWTQREFYQLAAFVGGEMTRLPGRLPKNMQANSQIPQPLNQGSLYKELDIGMREGRMARRIVRLNRSAVWEHPFKKLKYPHDYAYDDAKPGDFVEPKGIFGSMPSLSKGKTRREAFAEWMTSTENPRFTMTIANRMWKRAFGVGLIEPMDDLRDDTQASNPELMTFLASEMKRVDYDLKEFLRIIYNTQAYQRQVTYDELKPNEPYHFPGPILRRMTAEQVWDSLLALTLEDPNQYLRPSDKEYLQIVAVDPKTVTAKSLIDKAEEEQDWRTEENKDRRKFLYKGQLLARASELPQPLPDGHFLRQFGQSDRQIIAAGNTEGTVPQILTMFNGPVTHMMLENGSVLYNEVTACKNAEDATEVIFLSILNRPPYSRDRAMTVKEI